MLAVVSLLGLGAIGAVTATAAPASATTVAKDGLTSQTASPSCWSIKQSYPASTDGIYWLWTPKLVTPQQFYCDMTTDGGGWVLIGRGREAWTFPYWGQGSPSDVRTNVTGPAAFAPATLPTPTVDGLLNGGRPDALPDGIRLRRATNTTGTTWQEVRMNLRTLSSWSWAFGAGFQLNSITFDGATTSFTAANSTYETNTTANVQVDNTFKRVTSYDVTAHNSEAGFAYGSSVTNGTNDPNNYLWEFANENSAIPFTQMWIRPKTTDADLVAAGVSYAPDSGTAASTVRPMLDRTPVSQGWAVTGINVGTAISNMNDYVKTFAQIGNVLYMGGKFLQVQHGIGGPTFTQSYLAAFDVNTGEWIPTFNPVINAPVWKIMASPDGTKLFVGGEFTSVNGQANTTALAALDPTTGAVVPSTSWQAYASRPTGSYDIRAMSIQGPWLYLGGNFTKITGGTGFNTAGPLNVSRMARVALTNGQPDWKWAPALDTAPMDINASAQGDRSTPSARSRRSTAPRLASPHETAMDTTTGALVPGLQPWVQTQPGVTEPSNTILEVGDHVYQGGSQHYLHSYARSNYAFEKGYIAQNNGGDYQALAYKDGILYGSCHCVTDYQFQDTTNFTTPTGYTRADPINLIGAYDTTNNMSALPEFNPTQLKLKGSGGEGPWALFFDSNGCMWAGGDLVRQGASASPYYGGYEKFCDRDTTPPSTPTNVQTSITGNNVTLSWTPSTDNATTPIQYEILKDDPTFGTIVVGTTFDRNWTDTGVTGTARYFVRAEDNTGNRSASTSVISVTPPPPAAATLVAHGDTWSYQDNGQDLGSAWRQPGFDSSGWSTGASQLGWGSKGETTTIGSSPITDYFVKHVNIPSPSIYGTVTVRLKADDGAVVYINGVEAVRSNLPAGPLTASTLASSFISGNQETTWNEYQVPASMFANGDNTIAVELHQATAANNDGIFDLELVARTSTEANPPTTPAPSVSNVTYSAATVSWAPSTDDAAVIGYLVRRNGTPVAFTTSTSFIDSGLTPTTNYSYDVLAYDTSGNASAAGTVGTTTLGNPTIVKSGDTWSYLATNTDPGTTWRQPGFNASSWATGPSQLGWGGRGELTTVPTGTLTQYYVHHFNVADPGSIPQLKLRLKRDDGAAVYLNGIEVVRNNLPTGPLTAGTFSSTKVTAADGVTWYEFTVPGNLLVTGDNVVAAEVHQDSKSDTRGVFDLELVRSTPAETNPPTRPVVSLTGTTDSSLSISWTASTDDSGILGYVVRRDGAVIAYTTGTSLTDSPLNGNSTYGYQVVAIDTSGNASTTGSLAATTTGTTTVVKSGDTWSYLATNTDPGTAWRQPGFDSSSWSSGPSQLGWGGRGELTTLPTGTLTQYFVRHVNVTDPSTLQTLALSLKRDDGAAVYINGTEVLRDNLPAGTLTAATYSSTKVTAADGVTWKQFTVPGTALVAGDNVIAAELHQDSKSDTRGVFDLELKATVVSTAPVVTLTAPANTANVSAPTTFSGLCTTSAGTVTVNVTGATPAILTAPCVANEWSTSSTLPDGGYAAVASQTAGTSTGTSSTTNFTVDSTAPVVTLDSPVTGTVLASTPTFSGTCSTTDGNVTVTLSGSGAATLTTPCTAGAWSVTSSPLGTGGYTAVASQTDLAGNVGSGTTNIQIDATAPTTTDNTGTIGNAWRTTAATITLTPTDIGAAGVGQTYYTTDGSTPTTASSQGTTITLSADGVYTIKYFSVDTVGNAEPVKTAATQIRVDLNPPVTTDNTASFSSWTNQNVTVTLTPTDTGSGVAATYYTTNGTTPTTASTKGTSIALTAAGTYNIQYFSVDNSGNAEPVKTATNPIRIDKTLPTVTDNTSTIGNAWKSTPQTVTLTPVDTGGSGIAATYYTTDGSTPTTASAQGTSIVLATTGTYSIKYFTVDAAGNAAAVKTAGTQIRIDTTAPTNVMTFPVNGGTYNATKWSAGCSTSSRICGTAADTGGSGLSSVKLTIQRSSDSRFWTGSTWSTTSTTLSATGTTTWTYSMNSSNFTSGVSYTVSSWSVDGAGGLSANSVSTFLYDSTAPTTSAAGLVTTNKNGAIDVGDTFSVTFNEAMNPATLPATGTLTLSRSNSTTSYGISGLTNGLRSTGGTGYLTSSISTRTVTFAGTQTISADNKTLTFTVTGACAGTCTALATTPSNGAFQYVPATALQDIAGNAASTSTITASSQVIF